MNVTSSDLARVERQIQELPAGDEICRQIRSALQDNNESQARHAALWMEIGQNLTLCGSFPSGAFAELLSANEFDVRWPMTFACWYRDASGASVDLECAEFLRRHRLLEQAAARLHEYPDEHQWATDFIAILGWELREPPNA